MSFSGRQALETDRQKLEQSYNIYADLSLKAGSTAAHLENTAKTSDQKQWARDYRQLQIKNATTASEKAEELAGICQRLGDESGESRAREKASLYRKIVSDKRAALDSP